MIVVLQVFCKFVVDGLFVDFGGERQQRDGELVLEFVGLGGWFLD